MFSQRQESSQGFETELICYNSPFFPFWIRMPVKEEKHRGNEKEREWRGDQRQHSRTTIRSPIYLRIPTDNRWHIRERVCIYLSALLLFTPIWTHNYMCICSGGVPCAPLPERSLSLSFLKGTKWRRESNRNRLARLLSFHMQIYANPCASRRWPQIARRKCCKYKKKILSFLKSVFCLSTCRS